jgi:hypothetical protein
MRISRHIQLSKYISALCPFFVANDNLSKLNMLRNIHLYLLKILGTSNYSEIHLKQAGFQAKTRYFDISRTYILIDKI